MAAACAPAPDPAAPPSAEDRLWQTVSGLTRAWMRQGRTEARALGLSMPQVFLLGGLREMGPIAVSQWVERMGATPSAMTGLLDGLERAGYVERVRDVEDRRRVRIALTPKGRRSSDRLRGAFRQRWRACCQGVPRSELDAATATLGRIAARLGPIGPLRGHRPAPGRAASPRRRARSRSPTRRST